MTILLQLPSGDKRLVSVPDDLDRLGVDLWPGGFELSTGRSRLLAGPSGDWEYDITDAGVSAVPVWRVTTT